MRTSDEVAEYHNMQPIPLFSLFIYKGMDTKQIELKRQLLKEYGNASDRKSIDFCREAYKFLTEGDEINVVCNEDNGSAISELTRFSSHRPIAVDIGLPSGTLWCDRNVGANSPEDYGAYFSWGNTEPHYPKPEMDWGDDEHGFDYKFNEDTYKKTEGYKLKCDIDLAHDAARVNMGEPWQMPNKDQIQELYDNCNWIRKTVNGVNGYLVVSKINGNSLFFACSGLGLGTTWNSRGGLGFYWSASFGSARGARVLLFGSGGVSPQYDDARYYGFAVRSVQNILK